MIRRRMKRTLLKQRAAGRTQMNQVASIRENLAKYPNCILLTRVGSFYESYFEQASEVASLLSIKLTSRTWEGDRVLMAGFPLNHLDKYLKILVQEKKRFVALCEEFRRPVGQTNFDRAFDRRVTRILTPGTLIDETFLNHFENNYLLAIGQPSTAASDDNQSLGLAWLDVSTGEFFTQETTKDGLRDEIARIAPQEVVINRSSQDLADDPLRRLLSEEGCFVSFSTLTSDQLDVEQQHGLETPAEAMDDLTAVSHGEDGSTDDPKSTARSFLTPQEITAIRLLTSFLHENLMEHAPQLRIGDQSRAQRAGVQRMQIDAHTIKALEIRETMREGGVTGTLTSVIKRTATSSGTRLLARWLCSPSTSIAEITARQSLVELFLRLEPLRRDVRELLRRVEDSSRIVQRFLLGRGDTDDLVDIRDVIALWSRVKQRIELERRLDIQNASRDMTADWTNLDMLLGKLRDMSELGTRINEAVYEKHRRKGIPETTDGSEEDGDEIGEGDISTVAIASGSFKQTIKPEFSPELANLHKQLQSLHTTRDELQYRLQHDFSQCSIPHLAVQSRWGFHVHISKSKRDLGKLDDTAGFVPIAQSGSTKAFFYKDWFKIGNAIAATIIAIQAAERQAFETLRAEATTILRRNARIMDEIDVTLSFATLAHEMNFVRPALTESQTFRVVNGRHPTVELGLLGSGRVFTPNCIDFTETSRLHVITGPNMAGKSTLLRQTALIAILAQIGSYVPAQVVELGIIDKVFSRVGAKDDLFRDRSTFMVEMLETAEILKKATDRSLVIMDEVGRGTTMRDGLAIAFATLQHLYSKNKCRALFATHFHEVADMLGYRDSEKCDEDSAHIDSAFQHVGFFCTDVDETEDGHFAYSHRLRPGVNRDSHGLKVAVLAGMPEHAIAVAKDALQSLRSHHSQWAGDRRELQELGKRLQSREMV
ncbi:muts domain V-domain-containing protein [Auriculariales sp. MPI-PUGE-AT-0066]|nr:muts domain V-domain-containing protein [Auriculariales sp. MPI-PUGE-AT-0066]